MDAKEYFAQMQELHETLVGLAHDEADEINRQVDQILKYRWIEEAPQFLSDGLIDWTINPVTIHETLNDPQVLKVAGLEIFLDNTDSGIIEEEDFPRFLHLMNGWEDIPNGFRLPTFLELKNIFSLGNMAEYSDKYPEIFWDATFFYPSSTPVDNREDVYYGFSPIKEGCHFRTDGIPFGSGGSKVMSIKWGIPDRMKILFVRDL